MSHRDSDLSIAGVTAYPTSFPVKPEDSISLGVGRVVKRDAVIVKVTTAGGLVGYGESHHGRAPGAVAHLINTTLRQLVLGKNAADVIGVWGAIYAEQLASHGMGAATCLAMSGVHPHTSITGLNVIMPGPAEGRGSDAPDRQQQTRITRTDERPRRNHAPVIAFACIIPGAARMQRPSRPAALGSARAGLPE